MVFRVAVADFGNPATAPLKIGGERVEGQRVLKNAIFFRELDRSRELLPFFEVHLPVFFPRDDPMIISSSDGLADRKPFGLFLLLLLDSLLANSHTKHSFSDWLDNCLQGICRIGICLVGFCLGGICRMGICL